MADLLWPGDERAGDIFTDEAFLAAMVEVEDAWLAVLAEAGIAPAAVPLAGLVGGADVSALAEGAEAGGNPVIGLVALLRERSGSAWVHRGLTSQDVVDTALVLCLRRAIDEVLASLATQARALTGLARAHRGTVMAGRTLTQHAVPITFGVKAAGWLDGLADAALALRAALADLPVSVAGAAGTLAAVVELAGQAGLDDPARVAQACVVATGERLGLPAGPPWHTRRTPITTSGDALATAAQAWGRIASDVALLSRPEIAEVREGRAGGSSTMPGKANPVLSVLLRRHALTAPGLAAVLHTAAGAVVDERPDGAWHAEWDTLRTLARRSVVASSQAADLLAGLVIEADAMASRVAEVGETLTAEQRSMGGSDGPYLGMSDLIVDSALERAARIWKDS